MEWAQQVKWRAVSAGRLVVGICATVVVFAIVYLCTLPFFGFLIMEPLGYTATATDIKLGRVKTSILGYLLVYGHYLLCLLVAATIVYLRMRRRSKEK